MSKVTLQSPENAQTGVATTGPLIWNAVEGWDKYRVEVALRDTELTAGDEFDVHGALIDRIVDDLPVDGKVSLDIDPPLSTTTEYVWRVRAARVEVTEPEPAVLGVTVSPSTFQVEQGSTENVTASVEVEGDASQDVTWQSSDTNVATVESIGSTSAAVTGVAAGSATITATSVFDETKTGTAALTVTEQSSVTDSRSGDEAALTDLRESTNFDNWFIKTGWDGTISLANTMTGVTVETINGELRVVELDMQKQTTTGDGSTGGNNLIGTLPSSIGNLRRCRKFNVKQNHFTGNIPASIGNMVSLERLSLGGQACEIDLDHPTTWFEGSHKGCGGSNKAFEHTNEFTGAIPTTIGNLTNLVLLEMRSQKLTGTLPAEIGQCTSLRGIFIDNQRGPAGDTIGGNLPSGWGGLVNLEVLGLSNWEGEGRWTGSIPADWSNWPRIRVISVTRNELTGAPPEFPLTQGMWYVGLQRNNFTGGFPEEYFNGESGNISKLTLDFSNVGGQLPQTIPDITYPPDRVDYENLVHLGLGSCGLTGAVPSWIADARRLIILYLDNNDFTSIPDDFFERFFQMRNFYLNGNNFNQPLPSSFGNARSNTTSGRYQFNGSGFNGKIPDNWVNAKLNGILHFYLNDNAIHGPIPVGIANWTNKAGTASSWRTGQIGLRLQNNSFTYSDLIPFLNAMPAGVNVLYRPQKPFPVDDYINPNQSGSNVTLNLSGIDIAGNSYQWRRNGNNLSNGSGIAGATSHTLELGGSGVVAGEYTLRITNANVPELSESISQPITVTA